MFETKNLYVLNKKDKDAVVYTDAFGKVTRVTKEDFGSEEEFLRFKALSDEDLHTEEKARHLESDHTLSLEGLSENAIQVCSVEESYEKAITNRERNRDIRIMLDQIDAVLTEVQRRRIRKCCQNGMTTREIAEEEHVSQRSVQDSIEHVKKKIKKIFGKKTSQNPLFAAIGEGTKK